MDICIWNSIFFLIEVYQFKGRIDGGTALHWSQYFQGMGIMSPVAVIVRKTWTVHTFFSVLSLCWAETAPFIFTDKCHFVLCSSWANMLNATFSFWVTKTDVSSSLPINTESEFIVSEASTEQRQWGIQNRKTASTRLRFEHQEWQMPSAYMRGKIYHLGHRY